MHTFSRIVIMASILLLATSLAWAAPPLRLGFSDVETYPYQMGNGPIMADPPGVAVELIRQAAHELGIEVQFQRMPNRRVLVALKNGDIDGAFLFSYSEERDSFAEYPALHGKLDASRRIARLAYHLYRLPNNPVQWDGSRFSNVNGKIGANTGYSIIDDLSRLGVPFEEAKNTEQNFEKLRIGRIVAVAAQDEMADPYLARLGLQVEKLPRPIVAKDYFLMFSHAFFEKNSATVEKLWDRIADLRERKGKELLSKYPLP